jgi:hypothetical protein
VPTKHTKLHQKPDISFDSPSFEIRSFTFSETSVAQEVYAPQKYRAQHVVTPEAQAGAQLDAYLVAADWIKFMSPNSTPTHTRPSVPLLIWWVLWFAMTNGLIIQRIFIFKNADAASDGLGFIAIIPLLVSVGIRFLLLPRLTTKQKAFPIFVAGLATAEACGLLGVILGGEHRDALFGAGLVMLMLYIPLFARNYDGGGNTSPFRAS